MRIVLFIVLMIVGLFKLVDTYVFYVHMDYFEQKKIESKVYEDREKMKGKTLQEKIIVPAGLEKEYEKIMGGKVK